MENKQAVNCIIFYNILMMIQTIAGRYQLLKGYQSNHITIGFGSYGQVKLARDLHTSKTVAVKIMYRISINQIKMHLKLKHPSIIEFLDYEIDQKKEITYMILQYADDGTLYDKIKIRDLTKQDTQKFFKNVCQAVGYLHRQQIMHRDIKPQNILLCKTNISAKLCDFGMASLIEERSTLCGTYEYMSPEMIMGKSYDDKIDIWALGILLFQMIAGHPPFRGTKPDEVLDKMKTKIFFNENFEQDEVSLIKSILRVTPSKRPTIQEILSNNFFNKIYEKGEVRNSTSTAVQSKKSVNKTTDLCLGQSTNPKKMAEFQKIIEKESTPDNVDKWQKSLHQQQGSSFPFYTPNNNQQIQNRFKPVKIINKSPTSKQSFSPVSPMIPKKSQSPLTPGIRKNKNVSPSHQSNVFNKTVNNYQKFGTKGFVEKQKYSNIGSEDGVNLIKQTQRIKQYHQARLAKKLNGEGSHFEKQ